jgi:RNA 2',3'-cyclic 3'-phosphodiesterase
VSGQDDAGALDSGGGAPAAALPVRAFIAVNLPAEVRKQIQRLQAELQAAAGGAAVQWTKPEQIHLTLRFLGNVPAESIPRIRQALEDTVRGVPPFAVAAEGLGCFPHARQPRIIWVGLSGAMECLQDLQARVETETVPWGEQEDRAFHPHLTIGRVKSMNIKAASQLTRAWPSGTNRCLGNWQVDRVDLMQSILAPTGAQYACLASLPLSGPAGR